MRKEIENEKPETSGRPSAALTHAGLIIASIFLLTYVDLIVLEKIHHPIAARYGVNWNDFNATIFQIKIPVIWWHIAFTPLGVSLFALLGIAAKSFRLFFAGTLMFATGWEDILYYVLQGKWLSAQLPWLDYSPIISLTRFLTLTEHVTSTGVVISSVSGLILSYFILFSVNSLQYFKKDEQ